jgi:hypothetical protein
MLDSRTEIEISIFNDGSGGNGFLSHERYTTTPRSAFASQEFEREEHRRCLDLLVLRISEVLEVDCWTFFEIEWSALWDA